MVAADDDRARHPRGSGHQVQIDVHFVREQANNAVRQFFAPITAPFRVASQSFVTKQEAVEAAQVITRRHPDPR